MAGNTEIERLREKARHDEAQALHHAKLEGVAERKLEIARNALQMKMEIDDIVKLTGLTREEIGNLCKENQATIGKAGGASSTPSFLCVDSLC